MQGKLHGGRGASGKCHCDKKWQDTVPNDSCSDWQEDYSRTEEELKDLARKYDIC